MFVDYRHDVCQVQKNKKFTVVLGLKSRVVTDFMQFILKILIRFDIMNYI
jgi:hypothetical protein